ncbi:MAG: lipid-A-disaccharide synthase [Gammaproteobacteria bacterium]
MYSPALAERRLRVAIVAGEPSGDVLGAGLLRALGAHYPRGIEISGIGGEQMIAAGCQSLCPMERLSVMGLIEVLARYPEIRALRRRLVQRLLQHRPDVFIGVDAPDFNLPAEALLHKAGIATVHYVSPQVWAWRRYRMRGIARAVDCMLTLFPFEKAFYQQYQVPVCYVGHPLANQIPMTVDHRGARQSLGLPAQGQVVALLPGSRMQEIRRLAPTMLSTARWLLARRTDLWFVMPVANAPARAYLESLRRSLGADLPITLLDGQARMAMAGADVVLVASGTATLEALLLKRPMVITYRTARLTYYLAKAMVSVNHVGLPNLLAGRSIVPELLQGAANPDMLGAAVLDWLERPERQTALQAEFDRIHSILRRDADSRAAEAVLELLQHRGKL